MNILTVEKLDKRHKGCEYFEFRIAIANAPLSVRLATYSELRRFCWDTWGPSEELVVYLRLHYNDDRSPKWAWHLNDFNYPYIYLKSDEELAFFKLKWM